MLRNLCGVVICIGLVIQLSTYPLIAAEGKPALKIEVDGNGVDKRASLRLRKGSVLAVAKTVKFDLFPDKDEALKKLGTLRIKSSTTDKKNAGTELTLQKGANGIEADLYSISNATLSEITLTIDSLDGKIAVYLDYFRTVKWRARRGSSMALP
ncbi:MAG: hypothetical protein AMXMBFR7_43570 [Planctomycetota bacterium]